VNPCLAKLDKEEMPAPGARYVLLVEDDALHARLAQMFLSDGGGAVAAVDHAETLASALDRLSSTEYDAVILDLGLPDGQGLEVLSSVLVAAAGAPVLVVTADDHEGLAVEAVRLGAQDFLIKGRFTRQQLRGAVIYAMERKRRLRDGVAEGLLESVLAATQNAILALRPEGERDDRFWRVVVANPVCEGLFGRSLREIEGARLDAVLIRNHYAEIEAVLSSVLERGAVHQHQLCLQIGKDMRWLLMDAVPCGEVVALTLTDVTPMKAREDELVAAQKLAQSALDDKVGLLLAMGQKVPGALQRILSRLDDAAEFLVETPETERLKFNLAGARAEAATLSSDVDALVNLRQSAGFAYVGENYLSVLEISPDLSAVVRAGDGAILFLNGIGRQILELPPNGDLSGRSFCDFVPADYAVLFEDGMSALRGEAARVPMHLERADGHLVDVELLVMDCPNVGIEAWAGQDTVLVSAVDTTRRNRASRRIIAREEQLRKIMDNVADAVVVVDEDGRIETLNHSTEVAFGLPMRDLVGAGVGRLLGPAEGRDGRPMTGLEAFLGGGVPARVSGWRRHLGRRADGDLFPIEIAVRDLNLGERHLFIGLIRDISERVAYEENILYMATHDLLTTLDNRTHFHDELGVVLAKAKQANARFGVMFFDLDHFKAINDSFGHLVGDRILSVFAKRLQSCLGNRARLLARLSADEFIALVENSGGPAELMPLAHQVCEVTKKPVVVDNHYIRVSCCIGIAEYPDAGPYAEDLIRGAEFAVRTAKGQGRDTVQVYDEALSASLVYRQRLETALTTALDSDEFQVYYQPKVDLKTGEVTGAEALIRWFHPELGLISPTDFIPLAEGTGQIRDIGEWVLRQVCRDQADWLITGARPVPVAVNLSAVQFRDVNLDATLRRILEEYDLPASLLELELTESALVEDIDQTVDILTRLKALGLSIAIDDFGSGYSSFGYLTRFPIDCLKIDRAFVCNIPNNANDVTVARAIIGMARNLELSLVAEGVETAEQARFLREHGCDVAQGYFYSRPVPLAAFRRMLVEGVRQPN